MLNRSQAATMHRSHPRVRRRSYLAKARESGASCSSVMVNVANGLFLPALAISNFLSMTELFISAERFWEGSMKCPAVPPQRKLGCWSCATSIFHPAWTLCCAVAWTRLQFTNGCWQDVGFPMRMTIARFVSSSEVCFCISILILDANTS